MRGQAEVSLMHDDSMHMDDDRIHCDAHAAVSFLEATEVDLAGDNPAIVTTVYGARLQESASSRITSAGRTRR
ncbi:MAG: hypothetical protein JWO85_567 [Candidatus Eremiobacteraeota bacterium]|nr:hypothetical protein [Candidatus Eremiobacteraeota bacterium]